MSESLKQKTFKGTLWSTLERFSVQGIAFVVMIIMARILTPDDYGLVGMLAVFIAVSQSLVDSGFSQALIRKQDRSEVDNSTVFYFNIGVGIVLYLILFFCAPFIARFYNQPILTPLTRLISLSVLINSFVVVQRALLTVKIDFKTQAKASFSAAIVSGVVGITMAYTGYGVWSIVWYQLTNLTVNVCLLWVFSKWRPKCTYSWKSFRELFGFGSKLAIGGVLSTLYDNMYLIVIGKFYNPLDLGLYTRAYQFGSLPSINIAGIIQRVSYPAMCTIQNDHERLKNVYLSYLSILSFILFPLMGLLIALSPSIVYVVLGSKWNGVILPLQLICGSLVFYPIQSLQTNILMTLGKSDLFLKIDILKKIIGIVCLCLTLHLGINWLCGGQIIATQCALFIHMYYTKKILRINISDQLKTLSFPFFSTTFIITFLLIINKYIDSYAFELFTSNVLGMAIYIGIAYSIKNNTFKTIIKILRNK